MFIFLAEDNPADAYLLREALASANVKFEIRRAEDGETALRALDQLEQENATLDLILLDLNLPKVSGHDLLARVRSRQHFQRIPVIVMTSSDSPHDRAMATALGVNHYFRKPSDWDNFLKLATIIKQLCGMSIDGLATTADEHG